MACGRGIGMGRLFESVVGELTRALRSSPVLYRLLTAKAVLARARELLGPRDTSLAPLLEELAGLSSSLKQQINALNKEETRAKAAALDAAELLVRQEAATAGAEAQTVAAAGRLQAREARLNRMLADLRYNGVVRHICVQ